jgi:signal transduction histidine kinase
MKTALVVIVLAVFVVFGVASLAQAATLAEVKAMAEKAAAYYKANGKDKAVAEFNNPKGQFVKGDVYVVLQGYDGVLLANGGNPKLVGQNHLELKDPTGKYFVKEMVEAAKKGGGWVTYSWTNPLTKKVQPKKVWVQKVEGAEMYVNCGLFE